LQRELEGGPPPVNQLPGLRGYEDGFTPEIPRGELVQAGVPVQVTIPLYPTSNLFMPGHRIRLDVSSSNFPRFDVNPNTGEAIGRERRRVVADNTVFHERGRESRVVVPIVPIGSTWTSGLSRGNL